MGEGKCLLSAKFKGLVQKLNILGMCLSTLLTEIKVCCLLLLHVQGCENHDDYRNNQCYYSVLVPLSV